MRYIQHRKGQSSLETTVAIVAVFILFLGSMKIFVWLNEKMVLRQEGYESSRVAAAGNSSAADVEVKVNESAFPKLDIFGVE